MSDITQPIFRMRPDGTLVNNRIRWIFPDVYWTNARVIDMRQARALAGLDTSELDVKVLRMILDSPEPWGTFGTMATCLHLMEGGSA
jgi:hypothetical protein